MNLLKKFLVSLFILFVIKINSQEIKLFRSNVNGLSLVEINPSEIKNYKYILKEFYKEGKITKKILLKDGKELKRWEYFYNDNILYNEKYFKENIIMEEYYYNPNRHKIRQLEYKNGSLIKEINYTYNKDGLVEYEEIINILNKQKTTIKYRYDNQFKIKQIERKYPDGRIVYWEAFLSEKGIMSKECYTLKDEVYIFYYNKDGQEVKGEILNKTSNKILKEWENFYTKGGKREKKIEKNNETDEIKIVYYNLEGLESRIEYYKDEILEKIEKFEYDENKNIINYQLVEGLNVTEIVYEYDKEKNLIKKASYDNNSLKKVENFNKDGSIDEILITNKGVKILTRYDKDKKVIFQKELK
ncbi:MAG TPA: hypothetical protein PLD75_07205 [Spirochaetota bacterium]|nr:hypothetical protein [Spirochaetota bacterium]